MVFKELILKVSSICNLNCKYCYVFNQGDSSYKYEPPRMSFTIANQVIERISDYCNKHSLKDFLIIFHGGEPLLAQKEFYETFVTKINKKLNGIDIKFALQTNGTLLSQDWIYLFDRLNISIGLSMDGTREASKYRIYRGSGKEAYNEIIQGVDLLYKNNYPVNILSVINTSISPEIIYLHLKEQHVNYVDFLFPDKTYDARIQADNLVSDWLISLFDYWYNDDMDTKPSIKLFDVIVGLILGIERGNEQVGRKFNQCICVKPNGNIQAVDNLMVCGDGFVKTEYNVKSNSFDDVHNNYLIKKYYNAHQDSELCNKCKQCIVKNICGGGHIAHRFSKNNDFDNPSVYCFVLFSLITHIQNKLVDELGEKINSPIEKLNISDYK
jgi:uncharacterized protein